MRVEPGEQALSALRRSPQGRWWLGGIGVLLVGLLATVGIACFERNDLDIYLAASRDLLAGANMYERRYNEYYRYFYSPSFALLVAPLAFIGPIAAKLLWGVSIIACCLRAHLLAERWLGLHQAGPVQRASFGFLLLLLLFQPIRDNINSMQVTALLLWLSLEGIRLIRADRAWAGAALIAAGLDMKLLPLVLLPYLAWRAHWKALALAALIYGALQVLPALVTGWEGLLQLHRSRAELLNPADPRHILDEEEPTFISLGSLLSAYLSTEGGSPSNPPLPRNLAQLELGTINALLWAGRAALALLALWLLRWPPFQHRSDGPALLREVGYLLLCTILFFPHQRNYSMLMAAPATAWLLHAWLSGDRGRWLAALLVAAFLGLNTELILGEFADVYAHYKVKSLLVIAHIAGLMAAGPPRPSRTAAPV
ncbi:MAG: glycosyltransferase family 87 protein [Flavobacteriales bacterium]